MNKQIRTGLKESTPSDIASGSRDREMVAIDDAFSEWA
jgi:hypothetical protein